MAHQLYQSQRYHECIDICIQILGIDYTQAQVWSLAGMVMLELKSFERAIAYFSQAMQYEPTQPNHTINCAEAYRRSGNPERCIAEIKMLLRQNTAAQNNSNLHFNLAKAYSDIGDSNHSIKHYTIAIKLDPNDLGAMFNLANAQVKLKNFGEAIELYLNALSKGYLDAGVNLANTYVQLGCFSEALQVYSAIYTHYAEDSDFNFNYANALAYANEDIQHTQALYGKAIALNPNNISYYINYAHFLLRSLRLKDGFRIYEERKKLPNMLPRRITNIWHYDESKKSKFKGKKVLVYHEQGLGDSIMFARFLSLLAKHTKDICVITQVPLVPLFTKLPFKCVSSLSEVGKYDIAISLLSLPLALGVEHTDDLAIMPFMCEKPQAPHKVKKIGICFSTDSQFSEANNKSIPLDVLMSALQDHKEIEIYSLNKPQCEELGKHSIIQKEMNDFADTYAIIDDMDMVISIDTSVAHLSASMGKHTLVLLNKRYDWRWGNGISTPWYQNVVCFTQSKMYEWSNVVRNLKVYLKAWI